jgi:hypothetical protein
MEFRQFLESIIFTSFWSDGTIIVVINGKSYTYHIPTYYHSEIRRLSKYTPGKALNYIKKLIKNGVGELLGDKFL